MFSKTDFQAWGKQNVVLFASVMTKITGRKDDALLRTYKFTGFPSMALLDAQGEVITKKIGRNLNSMRAIATAAPAYLEMKKAVADGRKVDANAWFLARMDMGELKLEDAQAEIGALTLPADQKKRVEAKIFEMELAGLYQRRFGPRNARGRAGQRARMRGPRKLDPEVVAAVHAAFAAGKRLPAGSPRLTFFEDTLLEAAKEKGDAAAFRFAFPGVRARAMKAIQSREARVKSMTAAKPADDPSRAKLQARRLDFAKKSVETARAQLAALEAMAAKFAEKQ